MKLVVVWLVGVLVLVPLVVVLVGPELIKLAK